MKLRKTLLLCITLLLAITIVGCSNTNTTNVNEKTDGFRTIVVSDYNGTVDVTRSEGDKLSAYDGLGLYNGDDVKVAEESDLTLDVDSDKHLYAEEKTHFWLEASGSEGHSKTRIHLESGSVLCRIEKTLNNDESFEVNSKAALMSVRGTVFRTTIITASDGAVYELVDVFDGKVVTAIEGSDKEYTVTPGQTIILREADASHPDTSFIMSDQIDPEFWQSSDTDIKLIKEESDLDDPFFTLPYEKMPSETVEQLRLMAEDGETLCDTAETLAIIQQYGHEYVETSRQEPDCTKDGVRHLHCNICGHEIDEVLPALGHNFVTIAGKEATCTQTGLTDGLKCDRCGKWDKYQKSIAALGHDGDPCTRCGEANPPEEPATPSKPTSSGDAYDPNLTYTINSVSIDNTSKPGNLVLSSGNFSMAVNSKANISDSNGGSHTEAFVMNIAISGSSLSTNPANTTTSSDILTNISSDLDTYMRNEFWNIYDKPVQDYIATKSVYSIDASTFNVTSKSGLPNSVDLQGNINTTITADQGGTQTLSPRNVKLICTISGSNYDNFSYSFEDSKYNSTDLTSSKDALNAKVEDALIFQVTINTNEPNGSFTFNSDPNHTSEIVYCRYGSSISVNGVNLFITSGSTITSCIASNIEGYSGRWNRSNGDIITEDITITYEYN